MAQQACVIYREEMHRFLTTQHFQAITLPNTKELVYGKIVRVGEHRLSLRVYTSIDPYTGKSRPKEGKFADIIRVQLYYMYEGKPEPVGRSQTVRRITTWKKNLQAAINKQTDTDHFCICPACSHPMVERERKSDGAKFWGCVTWRQTKCSGKSPEKEMPWERDDREWQESQ